MRSSIRIALAPVVALALGGCLDANELDAPRFPTVDSDYVDLGIPLDPRDERDAGAGDAGGQDGGGGGGEDGGGGGEDAGPECETSDDCTAPFICVEGACQPECEVDADCGDGFVCADFTCVELECIDDSECDTFTEVCDGGLCEDAPCNLVAFTYDPGGTTYDTVHVAGDFNATDDVWPPTIADGGYALTWYPDDGVWFGRFDIPNGSYQYKLVLDEDAFVADPANPDTVPDPFGGVNSVLTVDCASGGAGACGDVAAFDWRDTVMYFVMVDRFYDSDDTAVPVPGATDGDADTGASGQYEGGDIAGVTARMPYLVDLGVSALWLSAPYDNRDAAGDAIDPRADTNVYSAYHGYWPSPDNIDYSDPMAPSPTPQVESRIGTAADLREMIAAAHDAEAANGHGVRVLFDYVMNHVDIDSGLYDAHPEWFARQDGRIRLCQTENLWDDPEWGVKCAFTDYLPPFDFANADARAWSVADAIWWAREFGIDGYRLDAIKHVPLSWLTDLRDALDTAIPEPEGDRFYLVGETFAYDDAGLIRRYVDPDEMLDGQFDFPFKARLCEALFTPGGNLGSFASWMTGNDTFYGDGALMTTWIGNHDIPRPIHFASGQIDNCRQGSFAGDPNTPEYDGNGWTNQYDQPRDARPYELLGLAFAVMMTNPGIPLIYYGDEIGLAGGGDPDNRRMMPWNDDDLLPAQIALRDDVRALARIRAENPVLSRGQRINRTTSQNTWVYSMIGCGDDAPDVTVAVHRGDAATTVDLPSGSWRDLVTDEVESGSIQVPARGWRVLRRD